MRENEPNDTQTNEAGGEEDVEAHLSKGTIGAGVAAAALFAAAPAHSKPAPVDPSDAPVLIEQRSTQATPSTKPKAKGKAKKAAKKASDFSKKPIADAGD